MPIVLSDLLTGTEARVLHDAAAALEFEDGKRTAGRIARAVKAVAGWGPDTCLTGICRDLPEILAPRPRADDVCLLAVRFD